MAHQARQDPEPVEEKPPAANFLVPLVTTDEDIHGQLVLPEEQHFPVRSPSPSPVTSSDDEKEKDLESGRARFTGHQAKHEIPVDPNTSIIVDWDGPDDPANPVNWSPGLKWANVVVVSAITFIT